MITSEKTKNIKELEKLASDILNLKKTRGQRRTLFIEFCGSPKAGKSTVITALNIFLKRNGFNTIVLTERASVCPIANKTHPFFNIWTLTSMISELLMHLDGKGKTDIIIADRGIFDALSWFEWQNTNPSPNNPYLGAKMYKELAQFILMDVWRNYLDLVYVFQVEPITSIKREYANLLTEKRGSIMSEPVLGGFNKAIQSAISKYRNKFRNVIEIQTDTPETDNDPNKVSYMVTQNVLNTLKDILIEKIGYIDPVHMEKRKDFFSLSNIQSLTLQFDDRDKVEAKDFIQPIPIAVLANKSRSKVLVVKKNSRVADQNSPEKDSLLLYIGGHVRKEDQQENIDTFLNTIEQALHREIQEEIGESIEIQNIQPFIIYTPDNPKSKKHFAICYVLEMDMEDKKFKLNPDEFVQKKGTSESGQMLDIKDIISGKYKIERWSREILKIVFNTDIAQGNLFEVDDY